MLCVADARLSWPSTDLIRKTYVHGFGTYVSLTSTFGVTAHRRTCTLDPLLAELCSLEMNELRAGWQISEKNYS